MDETSQPIDVLVSVARDELPAEYDERAILAEAQARRLDLTTMGDFWIGRPDGPPTLLVGYGQIPEPAMRTAVDELADAVHATVP